MFVAMHSVVRLCLLPWTLGCSEVVFLLPWTLGCSEVMCLLPCTL